MSIWPDKAKWDVSSGSGITLPVADWLLEKGILALGSDTEAVEAMPSGDPKNPHPVHLRMLIEQGKHLLECLYLDSSRTIGSTSFSFSLRRRKSRAERGCGFVPSRSSNRGVDDRTRRVLCRGDRRRKRDRPQSCLKLREAGYTIVAADRDAAAANAVAAECGGEGIAVDVSDEASVAALYDEAGKRTGKTLQILVTRRPASAK